MEVVFRRFADKRTRVQRFLYSYLPYAGKYTILVAKQVYREEVFKITSRINAKMLPWIVPLIVELNVLNERILQRIMCLFIQGKIESVEKKRKEA